MMFDKSREIQFDELILLEHIWAESVHFINIELKIIGFFLQLLRKLGIWQVFLSKMFLVEKWNFDPV